MIQTPAKTLTLEAFLKLAETKPASEYIDGKIIQKPMPQGKHSIIQTEFSTIVNVILKPRKVARAFSELRCTFGGRSIVPDVSVFTWERIPRDKNGEVSNTFMIAPDWTVEILSPDQNQTKVTKNILHCLNHGTQMGWLIDPKEQTVFIYHSTQKIELFDQPEQILMVPSFAHDINLSVGSILAWLLE
ncbi:Uma2 family endonuclease [Crocosphaera sp. XPORK-15E]|uniref:Uma2 family endonuclease n=1 Tax=Crocosphaera sp. XPORK-15E TaxID=3110247 RepID=UPI002B219DEE|nr:Uma2 family endonuclease [Crocosphaera sp. XPORK-15E]MEA5533016.1 Uma2 family endonuclease [Crocosphaera sp. XPORK-15E]